MAAAPDMLPDRPRAAPRALRTAGQTSRARLLADRLGTWGVVAGGMAVIASILAIMLFILFETLPLLRGARVQPSTAPRVATLPAGAILADEYRSLVAHLGQDGRLRVVRLADGALELEQPVVADGADGAPARLTAVQVAPGSAAFVAGTADGRVLVEPVRFSASFVDGARRTAVEIVGGAELVVDPAGGPVPVFAGAAGADGGSIAVAPVADGLAIVRRSVRENEFSGERTESVERVLAPLPAPLTALAVDADGRNAYGGTADGQLLWWRLGEGAPVAPQAVPAGGSPVTALSLLTGHRSLLVGQQDGSLSVWFPVRREGQDFVLTRIRDFPAQGGPIVALTPSPRDKGFFALDGAGGLGLYYSTSHRTLWTGRAPVAGAGSIHYAPKADALFVAGPGQVAELLVDNPHPEVSLEALFSKIWYEGYEAPRFTWQSSSGTDDFEPKLSLTPLLAGTLKGTLYSLILAIPLAVFGAMYTSQFMHHSLKRFVKPTVEIMAALPSVVLGFIAGLWLAPRLDQAFPGLLLLLVVLPLSALLAGAAWRALPARVRGRFPAGSEVLVAILFLAFGAWLSFQLGPLVERWAFGGRFQSWLLETTGLAYDQRNAVVVGLAMGFAVIPIIFSVAEEAFSNVPQSLVAGSLALGASRWQTVLKVVLPTASAGIFSAIMIGFGRAVGETMIVLMATGNTPIMDWSPFNGFRTLSANIAVEIPEAPQGGTLYRTLFLAGLLLFALTFAVNTVAEIVRQNLRRRYANL